MREGCRVLADWAVSGLRIFILSAAGGARRDLAVCLCAARIGLWGYGLAGLLGCNLHTFSLSMSSLCP